MVFAFWNGCWLALVQPQFIFRRDRKVKSPQNDMSHPKQSDTPPGNAEKDPDDWTTGDEAMTGAQASYLKTLSEEAGTEFDPAMTKAEASKRIDALQQKTGRGTES